MFYYFLLADHSGCFTRSTWISGGKYGQEKLLHQQKRKIMKIKSSQDQHQINDNPRSQKKWRYDKNAS